MGGSTSAEIPVDYVYCFTSGENAVVSIVERNQNGEVSDVCRTTAVFRVNGRKLLLREHPDGPLCQNSPDASYLSSSLSCDLTKYGLANCTITTAGNPDNILAVFKRGAGDPSTIDNLILKN
jgi:hypothetical protein